MNPTVFPARARPVPDRAGYFPAGLWIACLCLAAPARAPAHTLAGEVVLVDTDAALDDLRALALLLDLPGVETLGVVTCEGSSGAEDGARLILALLQRLDRTDIPVFAGSRSKHPAPPWRPLHDKLATLAKAEPAARKPGTDWKAGFSRILTGSEARVTILALGPLSNLAALLTDRPALKERISKVVWYGSLSARHASFNREFDPVSAGIVAKSGVPLIQVSAPVDRDRATIFDPRMLSELARGNTRKGQALRWLFGLPEARSLLEKRHFPVWDELPVLWLVRPELFSLRENVLVPDPERIAPAYIHFFRGPAGSPAAKDTEVFDRFPARPATFRADIAAIVPDLLERYGPDEFRGCVLVSELHQHLGLYSIIGVKMSMRAREVLGVQAVPLRVTSWAGLQPPFSCLNDGLQVGAGATMGLGRLTVRTPAKPEIRAAFAGGGKRVTLALKQSVMDAIRADISKLKKRHGGFTGDYYRELRGVAIRYWRELDRDQVFEVR